MPHRHSKLDLSTAPIVSLQGHLDTNPFYYMHRDLYTEHFFLHKEFKMVSKIWPDRYLNSRLAELRARRQPLSGADARIVRLVELLFKLFELLGAERCSIAAEFRLIAVEARRVLTFNICRKDFWSDFLK